MGAALTDTLRLSARRASNPRDYNHGGLPWAPQRARAAFRGQLPRPPSRAGGRPTVRQFPTSPDPLSLGMTDHKKGKRLGLLAQAAPSCFRRLARPRSDYRTWMLFPASCRPSARSERAPPPVTTPSRSGGLLMRFRGLLACLLMPACVCICAGVRRCAIGPCAESPRSARPQRHQGNNS